LSNLKYFLRKLNNAAASLWVSEQVYIALCLAVLETQCRQITYGNTRRITPGKYVDEDSSVGIPAKCWG